MGDSHAGNIYWSLINNNKFSSALDVKLHGAIWPYCFKNETSKDRIAIYIKQNIFKNFKIKKMCEKEEKNFKLNNLLRSADVIILSSRWNDKLDLKKIINYLKKKSSAKIIMMGRTPEFVDIPTLYYKFDKNLNHIAYLKRNSKIDDFNNKVKETSKSLNIEYFDRTQIVCKFKECVVIHNNKLLYTDHDHWSHDGAIFFGEKLYEYGLLDLIKK